MNGVLPDIGGYLATPLSGPKQVGVNSSIVRDCEGGSSALTTPPTPLSLTQMSYQVIVDIGLGVQHQPILRQLQLMQEKHHHDTQAQGH